MANIESAQDEKTAPKPASCHPSRPLYSRGLCRPCYDTVRWTGKPPRTLAGEARAVAEEATAHIPRVKRKAEKESRYIRTQNPKVANFVAGVAVKNFLDMEKAVEEIRPKLTPYQIAETAQKLERDPYVQGAIQKTLEKRGLDEKSKGHFVDLLWRYAESEDPSDEKRQLQSMRILGKAFVGENVHVEKMQPLKIQGADEIVTAMLGEGWEKQVDSHDALEEKN
jgi:hypothetical protein